MIEQIQPTPPYDGLPVLHVAAPPDTKVPTSTTSSPSIPSGKEVDVVTISASALANRLYLQGDNVTQISAQLGLTPATVESDLNITADSSVAAQTIPPINAQTPATQITPADASTPFTAAFSPFTAPTLTTDKVS